MQRGGVNPSSTVLRPIVGSHDFNMNLLMKGEREKREQGRIHGGNLGSVWTKKVEIGNKIKMKE